MSAVSPQANQTLSFLLKRNEVLFAALSLAASRRSFIHQNNPCFSSFIPYFYNILILFHLFRQPSSLYSTKQTRNGRHLKNGWSGLLLALIKVESWWVMAGGPLPRTIPLQSNCFDFRFSCLLSLSLLKRKEVRLKCGWKKKWRRLIECSWMNGWWALQHITQHPVIKENFNFLYGGSHQQ